MEFFATYVADVMTSSVKTTQDIAWTLCFFLSGDFMLSLKEYHAKGGSWQARRNATQRDDRAVHLIGSEVQLDFIWCS